MNQLPINFIRDREVKFSIFGCNEVHASLLLSQVEATDDNGMLKMVFILVIWRFCVTSMIWVLAFV